jgi:hypothetical protein
VKYQRKGNGMRSHAWYSFACIDCIKGGSLRDISNHARGCYIQVFVLVIHTSQRSFDEFKGNAEDRSRRQISVLSQVCQRFRERRG